MTKMAALGLSFALILGVQALAKPKNTAATGWVSDENCGARHTKPGGAGCIKKCMRGGQDIGHPEWKPQRMVFVNDTDKAVWIVANPEALRGQEGQHVKLTGRFDGAKKSLRVNQAAAVAESGAAEKK